MEEALFYKESEGSLYIRAQGHVTASLCPQLKARIFARIETSPLPGAVYFDLGPCEYMDSTFLGLIVGVNKRFRAAGGAPVVLQQVSQTCLSLLKTIGVTKLVTISEELKPFPQLMEAVTPGPRATAEFLLDAHENLSELSEDNRARFSTLTSALKKSMEGEKQ